MEKIYENIRKLRKEKGLTQKQLAGLVGYASSTMIASIEKGNVDLPYSKVKAFAKALDVPVIGLLGYEYNDFTLQMADLPHEAKRILEYQLDFAIYNYGTKQ